jgi:carboxynorspermidine decarboxylase
VAKVLDIVDNGMKIAILDTSAACHMPDVLEMPYRPNIVGAGQPAEHPYTYRLAAIPVWRRYYRRLFLPRTLKPGDKLVFCDMAHYTMVKNNMFNGVNLPISPCTMKKRALKLSGVLVMKISKSVVVIIISLSLKIICRHLNDLSIIING